MVHIIEEKHYCPQFTFQNAIYHNAINKYEIRKNSNITKLKEVLY